MSAIKGKAPKLAGDEALKEETPNTNKESDVNNTTSLIAVSAETLPEITWKHARVITTELLARLYGVEDHQLRQNFNNNQNRFEIGKHYFKLEGQDLREFKKNRVDKSYSVDGASSKARAITLWTERGAARHAKMLETNAAWDVFEKLEDSYFSVTAEHIVPAIDYTRINPAQAQTLKELVQMVVESGKQSYGETWARLHNKFRVNSYLELSAQQFEDACDYLRSKAPQAPAMNMAQVTSSMEAANVVAAQVQAAVFEKLMTGNSRMGNGRWMLSFASGRDNTTVPCVTLIDDDAFVMSLAYLATAIVVPGGMMPSKTDLANLASACNKRLSAQLTYEANRK